MAKSLSLLVRSLWSKAALAELYANRKAMNPSEQNRTPLSFGVAFVLFAAVFSYLMFMAWSRQDAVSYLDSRTEMVFLPELDGAWTEVPGQPSSEGMAASAYKIRVPRGPWDKLKDHKSLVVTLPSARYRMAEVAEGGVVRGAFYDNARLTVPFDPARVGYEGFELVVTFHHPEGSKTPAPAARPGNNKLENHVAIMPARELREYDDFLAVARAGRGDQVGATARVAMAVFVLILFLIVDSSPETLGLSLFLGFEGVAISLSRGWLPFVDPLFVQNFCFQMGDIFRLFFALQLARMIDKRVVWWLVVGTALSLPYAWLRVNGPDHGLTFQNGIPSLRDALVGTVSVVVLLRSAWFLRGKKLPWRVAALVVASIGAFEQMLDPVFSYVPLVHDTVAFRTLCDLLQPAAAWLLAFSAFINISTLENRVKVLSHVEARAREMDQEMELGRTVQRAFHNVPELPESCRLAHHHEAMLYVSGDTFFVNCNRSTKRITFLINDVTGHGVQAALKASAANVIAKSLWEEQRITAHREGNLATYDQQLQAFLGQISDQPDINAMGGCEFDTATGAMTFYRANFPFPLLIEPAQDPEKSLKEGHLGELWRARILPLPNRSLVTRRLAPGSFVLMTSDGFLDTSRRTREFMHYLRRYLATKDATLSVDAVKGLFLRSDVFRKEAAPDDRTVLVFQWDGRKAA